jgi:hypothetical protein
VSLVASMARSVMVSAWRRPLAWRAHGAGTLRRSGCLGPGRILLLAV